MLLYHATYGPLIPSIKEKGLIPRFFEAWKDIQWGIYLANNQEEARSYCECADNEEVIPDEWLDDIVVLEIDQDKLDQTKLLVDPNVKTDHKHFSTYIYKGVIPTNEFCPKPVSIRLLKHAPQSLIETRDEIGLNKDIYFD